MHNGALRPPARHCLPPRRHPARHLLIPPQRASPHAGAWRNTMTPTLTKRPHPLPSPAWSATAVILIGWTLSAAAQSPWERAARNLETSFTGPLARSLPLVAIALGGPMFIFADGGPKRQISAIVFRHRLTLFAPHLLT